MRSSHATLASVAALSAVLWTAAGIGLLGQVQVPAVLPEELRVTVDPKETEEIRVERAETSEGPLFIVHVPVGGTTVRMTYDIDPGWSNGNPPRARCELWGKHWVKSLHVVEQGITAFKVEYPEADVLDSVVPEWVILSAQGLIETRVGDYAEWTLRCTELPPPQLRLTPQERTVRIVFTADNTEGNRSSGQSSDDDTEEERSSSSANLSRPSSASVRSWSSALYGSSSKSSFAAASSWSAKSSSAASLKPSSSADSSKSAVPTADASRHSSSASSVQSFHPPVVLPPWQWPVPSSAMQGTPPPPQERDHDVPGCFDREGRWTTDRGACDEEQRARLLQLQQDAEAARLPPAVIRELADDERDAAAAMREEMAAKALEAHFIEREQREAKRLMLIATLEEAAKRVRGMAGIVEGDAAKVYLTEAGGWYAAAAAYASDDQAAWHELYDLVETSKQLGTDVDSVVRQFGRASAPPDPSPIAKRLGELIARFPQAVAFVRQQGVAVDAGIDTLAAEAQRQYGAVAPSCLAQTERCADLDLALTPLETASSLLREALVRQGRSDLIDALEQQF